MAVSNIPEIRERNVGEVLDASFKLMFRNFKSLIPFVAAIVLPFQVLTAAVVASAGPSLIDTLTEWSDEVKANPGTKVDFPGFTAGQIGAVVVTVLLTVLSTYILQAGLTAYVGHLILDGTVDRRMALRAAVRRSPVMFFSSVLLGLTCMLIVVVGVLSVAVLKGLGVLVLIPSFFAAIWMYFRLSLNNPPIMLENAGPVAGLKRSFALTRGKFWKVFGATLLGGIISSFVGLGINGALSGVLSSLGGSNKGFEFVWSAIAGTVSTGLTAPLSAAIGVFLYFDLRVRSEGFDLERLANDLGRGSALMPTRPDDRLL